MWISNKVDHKAVLQYNFNFKKNIYSHKEDYWYIYQNNDWVSVSVVGFQVTCIFFLMAFLYFIHLLQ